MVIGNHIAPKMAPSPPAPHDIGWAVKQMWDSQRVRRRGWHGRGMWLEIQVPDLGSKMNAPYVYICIPTPEVPTPYTLVPWLCSQTDLLSLDWELAE